MDKSEPLLDADQKKQLELLVSTLTPAAIQRRARILLAYDVGEPTNQVSSEVHLSTGRVRYWRREFRKKGMDIFNSQAKQEQPPLPAGAQIFEEGAGHSELDQAFSQLEPEALEQGFQQFPKSLQYPKPLEKAGVLPTDPLAEAGRKILLFHFAEMVRHEEGTRKGDDPEDLHDMRVATRRMRAALRLFGDAYKPKAIKPFLKGLREAGQALGAVRDMDVFIEKAQKYVESLPESERSGLDPLLAAWNYDREVDREKLLEHLDSPSFLHFKQKFNHFLQTPGAGACQEDLLVAPAPRLARDIAPVLIYTRISEVRAYETILNTATLEQLHALRIEFKRLRYAVEFFREILGEQSKDVINTLKEIQDHLGDLNDARVASQMITDFLNTWESRQEEQLLMNRLNPEPIVAFLAAKMAERHNLMITFPQTWEKFIGPEFRKNLALAVAVL